MTFWLALAKSYLGLKESAGAADNSKVVALYALAGHPEVKHDSVAWCAAFVSAVLAKAHIKNPQTLWALDYAKWGQPLDKPILGCVGVKKRNGGGHVGFVVGANEKSIILLGGNQGDAVSVAAFPRENFVAFRWPAEVRIPDKTTPLPSTVVGAQINVTEA